MRGSVLIQLQEDKLHDVDVLYHVVATMLRTTPRIARNGANPRLGIVCCHQKYIRRKAKREKMFSLASECVSVPTYPWGAVFCVKIGLVSRLHCLE